VKELYKIVRYEYGWLLCATPGQSGIPLNALQECLPMFPKDSVIEAGIVHHYNVYDNPGGEVIFAVTSVTEAPKWKKEIEKDSETVGRRWL